MSLLNRALNRALIIDRRHLLELRLPLFLSWVLLTGGCATIETSQYPEGPYIVSTYPSTGDFNISRYTDISIRFSESMDSGTETGFEMLSKGMRVEGATRWVDSNTVLIFRPHKPLEANSLYQCIIRGGTGREGKSLAGVPYIWMFTTGN